MTFTIPEIPPFPDIVIPSFDGPLLDIVFPPMCLCTFCISCKGCGADIHGSRCSERWEEVQAWIEAHLSLCDACTAKEN